MRRVVVTGLGLVTPLGGDVETTWANLIAAKSGAGTITKFDPSDQKCRIACEVKPADHEYGFDPNKRVDHKVQRQVDPFIVYGIDAAGQAIEDAGLADMDEATKLRAGCSIGSGIGGLPGIESESLVLAEKGPGRVSPHFVHGRLINLISGQVSIKYGLMGPNHAVVTACSTGAHSIGDAARMIKDDDADIMLAGGAEATICPIGIAGFAQARALSTAFNDQPEKASRPYDKDRDGFVMGEGAGVVVLEEYEHAKARGAKIYAEVVGYGLSGDAYHVTAPHPEGSGAYRSMEMALKKAGMVVETELALVLQQQQAHRGELLGVGSNLVAKVRRCGGDRFRRLAIGLGQNDLAVADDCDRGRRHTRIGQGLVDQRVDRRAFLGGQGLGGQGLGGGGKGGEERGERESRTKHGRTLA